MKQHYRLLLAPRAESKPNISLTFYGTLWQANRAFQALRVALHNSEYSELVLALVGKNDTPYKLNGVLLTGGDNGL